MISPVQFSRSHVIIPRGKGQTADLPDFRKNQVVKATVLAHGGPGMAKLLINGRELMVKTSPLLVPGEKILLKVADLKEAVTLQLMGPVSRSGSRNLASVFRFFLEQVDFKDLLNAKDPSLVSLLSKMALKSDKGDGQFLPRLISSGGLLLEKKLASVLQSSGADHLDRNLMALLRQDVKGRALEMQMQKGGETTRSGKGLFLDTIETLQVLNSHTGESGRYFIPFPVLAHAGFNWGQLFIDLGGKKEEENGSDSKNVTLSFLLNMTRLGGVRADFSVLKKKITGGFLLENQDICSHIRSLVPELKSRLGKIGFQPQNIHCRVARESEMDPRVFMETSLKENSDPAVNIVV